MRVWLSTLLALAVNSSFWNRTGSTYDLRTTWWNARLPLEYPTMKTRVCNTQLDAPSTLLLAALTRALRLHLCPETRLPSRDAPRSAGPASKHGLAQPSVSVIVEWVILSRVVPIAVVELVVIGVS